METKRIAQKLHLMGVNITAIAGDGKAPIYKWRPDVETRQDVQRLRQLPWTGYTRNDGTTVPPTGRIGVIHSDTVGQWRCFDIDACKNPDGSKTPVDGAVVVALLNALGLPEDYEWCMRSGSGAGWHVYVRCDDPLPTGAMTEKADEKGVYTGVPKTPGSFDHIELRWHGVQSVPAFKSVGEVPDTYIADVTAAAVVAAFKSLAKELHAPKPATKPHTTHHTPGITDDMVATIKDRLDIVTVANKLYGAGHQEGQEVRYPNHGGLLVSAAKQQWFCHQEQQGGDVLDLLCYHQFGSTLNGDKDRFKDILKEAASMAGVELPKIERKEWREHVVKAIASQEKGTETPPTAVAAYPLLPVTLQNETLAGHAEELDKGDSELLVSLYPNELRYDHKHKAWYFWNGTHWQRDNGEVQVRSLLSSQVRSQYQRALIPLQAELGALKGKTNHDETETKRIANLERWCKALGSRIKTLGTTGGCKSVATFAQIYLSFNGHWNAQKTILPCKNGYVDLTTGALLPFNPLDYFTHIIPINYNPSADAPLWQAFLDTVQPDKDTQEYLQTFAGYAATGVAEELCAFFVGGGANGKTTFCNVLGGVLGEGFSTELNPEALMEVRGQKSYDLANVEHARLVVAREMRNGTLATNTFKQLVDIGKLNIERKYEQPYTIERTHSLIVYANATPRITDTTNGTWRRLHLVTWNVSIPDKQRVTNFHNRILKQDAEGVLAWLVRGAVRYLADGIKPTAAISQATNELRQSEDEIGGFLAACCVEAPTSYVPCSVLYEAYADYVQAPVSQRVFGKEIGTRFGASKNIRVNGKPTRCFQGVGLLCEGVATQGENSVTTGFSPSESRKPDTTDTTVTLVTLDTIKSLGETYAKTSNEKFSVTSVTSVTNIEDACDTASESPKPQHTSCVTSVTPPPTVEVQATNGAGKQQHWGDVVIDDYRLSLLSKLSTQATSKQERYELYRAETSELESKLYPALVTEGKIDEARALAQASSEPEALLGFIDALIETLEMLKNVPQ